MQSLWLVVQVTVLNTAETLDEDGNDLGPPSLEGLTDSITALVGTPHNYSVEDPTPPHQDDAPPPTVEEEEAVQQLASTAGRAADLAPSLEEVGNVEL